MYIMDYGFIKITIASDNDKELAGSLDNSFTYRYLPRYGQGYGDIDGDVYIEWRLRNSSFKIIDYSLGVDKDVYIVESPLPKPYVNESPIFFLLQAYARACVKKGYLVFTDTASIFLNNHVVLLTGYPHTGKSTLSALAYVGRHTPLSTENTVLYVDANNMRIVDGTPVLVYDPRISEIYGFNLPYDEETRHGYRVMDIDKHDPNRIVVLRNKPIVKQIYILHCSYSMEKNVGLEPVRGRKIKKTLWYFATSLLYGLDYYEPMPLNLMDNNVMKIVSEKIDMIARNIGENIYEIYGRHDKALEHIVNAGGGIRTREPLTGQ